ncbi:MAG: MAPEG family protein [Pseudomonadota bacterium]
MLPVTALYAGLLGLWLIGLSVAVIRLRWRHRVSLGDGGVAALERACRAHGNAVETIPITLIMLGLAEGLGTPAVLLHLFGLGLLVGRVLHGAYFFVDRPGLGLRQMGMGLTFLVMGALAIGLVAHSLAMLLTGGNGAA